MKNILTIVTIVIIISLGIYYFILRTPAEPTYTDENSLSENVDNTQKNSISKNSTTTPNVVQTNGAITSIGKSVNGLDINAYHFGTGSREILLVGGIHGGYSWNTSLLSYQLINYLKSNPDTIPQTLKVTIIPVLNPDGLSKAIGTISADFTLADVTASQSTLTASRFNTNNVDLNRNFDCNWKATGVWQSKTVNGGSSVFSESESLAMKNYINTNNPSAVIVYYSAAGGVYASSCGNTVSAETSSIMKAYATASAYPSYESFDAYSTTGDMTNWLSSINIPAISVLLTNHTDTELQKNEAGLKAVLDYYSK